MGAPGCFVLSTLIHGEGALRAALCCCTIRRWTRAQTRAHLAGSHLSEPGRPAVTTPAFCFFTERAKPDTRLVGVGAKLRRCAPFFKNVDKSLRIGASGLIGSRRAQTRPCAGAVRPAHDSLQRTGSPPAFPESWRGCRSTSLTAM